MHLTSAVHALLLGLVAWNLEICGVESLPSNDRIIFPDDAPARHAYNSITSTSSTTTTPSTTSSTTMMSSSRISPSPIPNPSTSNSNSANNLTTASSTTAAPLDDSGATTDFPDDTGNTTDIVTVDNRILVETLPVCPPGQSLRAGRCRKSA